MPKHSRYIYFDQNSALQMMQPAMGIAKVVTICYGSMASLNTAIIMWNVLLISCGHTVHGTLHALLQAYSIAPIMIIYKCS